MNTDKFFKVNEIFFSIQGESMFMGKPTIFLRFTGCPFDCSYCDTTYAFTEGTKMSIDEILNSIVNYKTRYVCITGGEPLVQPHLHDLTNILLDKNWGKRFAALSIGPATNWGKKLTKVANEIKSVVGFNLFLYISSEYEIVWNV